MADVIYSPQELRSIVEAEKSRLQSNPKEHSSVALQAISIDSIRLLPWLRTQVSNQKFFWRNRSGEEQYAGIGVSKSFVKNAQGHEGGFNELSKWTNSHPQSDHLFALGGTSFFPYLPANSEWKDFGSFQFIVPKLAIVQLKGKCHAIVALPILANSNTEELCRSIEHLVDNFPLDYSGGVLSDTAFHLRTEAEEQSQWEEVVRKSLTQFEQSELDKVVLAHSFKAYSNEYADTTGLLERLYNDTSHNYTFFFKPTAHQAFLTFSPERLVRRDNNEILCDALAGTAPRGKTLHEDRLLGSSLLLDQKIKREFGYVRDFLESVYQRLARTFDADRKPQILKLRHVQHLHIKFSGELLSGVTPGEIVSMIHPTPAVGGAPSQKALDFIREHESFDRGWYAAPVGVVRKDFFELAVGIRSALIKGCEAQIFAGAGIVPGSIPTDEWQELMYKIQGFLRGLSIKSENPPILPAKNDSPPERMSFS